MSISCLVRLKRVLIGIGLSPDTKSRIFEPLFTTKLKGAGLGLSIVANIVRRHGGSISVESIEGAGSTFRISIPLRFDSW